jgi:hypothetical protein
VSNDVRAALLRATVILAQHTGGHQHRLAEAYASDLANLDLTGLPAIAVEKLRTLRVRLTYAGTPEISAMLLDDDQAVRLIRSIVDLCMDVSEVSIADSGTRALEKCLMAVLVLAESQDDLRARLATAVANTLFALAPRDVPDELVPAFHLLHLRMTHEPAIGDEGTIVATTQRMTDDEAKATIAEIVRLYGALIEIGARA